MSSPVMTVVRIHCKTCPHSYDPRELLGGLCSNCLAERMAKIDGWAATFNNPKFHCDECNSLILAGAYRHWDALANTFATLCIPCSEKAIHKDIQYHGTEFGWKNKVG